MNKNILEAKKFFEKKEIVTEKYEISGRVLDLLKKFAMESFLSKRKYDIMKLIIEKGENMSVDEISNKFNMSKPLIAYHMNGNLKNYGMINNELLVSHTIKGVIYYNVTDYGKFIYNFAKVVDSGKGYKKVREWAKIKWVIIKSFVIFVARLLRKTFLTN